jgi:hypothetical protein
LDTQQSVNRGLDAPVPGVGVHLGHVIAEGNVQADDERDDRGDLQTGGDPEEGWIVDGDDSSLAPRSRSS